ncbi:MAG: DUF2782 domain-containing protein [Magnetococcales bacterium]|nr:DUF2782 domain-containing protein [Magnetococcales bacterium]
MIVPQPAFSSETEADGVKEGGYEVPQKGPLISELREDVDPDVPGPETVIRKYEDAAGNQVLEFITNGAIFQYEVIPFGGVPYYLIDTNGDGLFESHFMGYRSRLIVPQWVLGRF